MLSVVRNWSVSWIDFLLSCHWLQAGLSFKTERWLLQVPGSDSYPSVLSRECLFPKRSKKVLLPIEPLSGLSHMSALKLLLCSRTGSTEPARCYSRGWGQLHSNHMKWGGVGGERWVSKGYHSAVIRREGTGVYGIKHSSYLFHTALYL
jgi:hypothetical protein